MEKKDFIKILSKLIEIRKDEDSLNEAFKKFSPDFNYISFSRYESLVVDTLKIAMNDTADWIGYFLYERNGEFTNKNIIKDKHGNNLPFRNMDDLYNLIAKK